jgi:hypothetical protein
MTATATAAKFKLRVSVRRSPRSIAPYWYTLDPGDIVHLVCQHSAVLLAVSEVENPAERIGEDVFHVAASEVEPV